MGLWIRTKPKREWHNNLDPNCTYWTGDRGGTKVFEGTCSKCTGTPIFCDYCGDLLPNVRDKASIPTTPNLQRLGFDADKIVCPECVDKRKKLRMGQMIQIAGGATITALSLDIVTSDIGGADISVSLAQSENGDPLVRIKSKPDTSGLVHIELNGEIVLVTNVRKEEQLMAEEAHYFQDTIDELERIHEELSRKQEDAQHALSGQDKEIRRITRDLDAAENHKAVAKKRWDEINRRMGLNREAVNALRNQGSTKGPDNG